MTELLFKPQAVTSEPSDDWDLFVGWRGLVRWHGGQLISCLCEQDMGWTLSWSALSRDWKLLGRHSTSPSQGSVLMCSLMMQKSSHSAQEFSSFLAALGLKLLMCPEQWEWCGVGPWDDHAGFPGTPMRSLPPLGHGTWGWHVGVPR